jgi:predicted Fe-Mo cluster-binding NifX family protein
LPISSEKVEENVMNLVVTVDSDNFEAKVSASFEACAFFMFIEDQNTKKISFVENIYKHSWSGADILCAQYIVTRGVNAVASGSFSTNALSILREAHIKVYRCPCIQIETAINSIAGHLVEPLDIGKI